jgi:hypothetical protein
MAHEWRPQYASVGRIHILYIQYVTYLTSSPSSEGHLAMSTRSVGRICHRSHVTSQKSQVTDHRSQITGHTGQRSQVTGHRSQVTGHRSHRSEVRGHRSQVTCHNTLLAWIILPPLSTCLSPLPPMHPLHSRGSPCQLTSMLVHFCLSSPRCTPAEGKRGYITYRQGCRYKNRPSSYNADQTNVLPRLAYGPPITVYQLISIS